MAGVNLVGQPIQLVRQRGSQGLAAPDDTRIEYQRNDGDNWVEVSPNHIVEPGDHFRFVEPVRTDAPAQDEGATQGGDEQPQVDTPTGTNTLSEDILRVISEKIAEALDSDSFEEHLGKKIEEERDYEPTAGLTFVYKGVLCCVDYDTEDECCCASTWDGRSWVRSSWGTILDPLPAAWKDIIQSWASRQPG